MKVLTINCGSSSLKFRLSETPLEPSGQEEWLAGGIIDGVGGRAALNFAAKGADALRGSAELTEHGAAMTQVLVWLGEVGLIYRLEAVGHRVVDGGGHFSGPTLVDNEVVTAIKKLEELAPLHNAASLAAILATCKALGPSVPNVATFDTTFHHTMPKKASWYAIQPELADRHGVYRYGFHGLAHRYMVERYAAITRSDPQAPRLVTLQLGNGCSATAVRDGRSVDTSMGFTPLEGLMMGTRSGDVDPSLPSYLAPREGVEVAEVLSWLNKGSGLLGVSGVSKDMREILGARDRGNERAALAVEMFCYRVKKQVGAYLAALGGADAIVFAGGIGEHATEVRAEICAGMEWCGLVLDPKRNTEAVGREARISRDDSVMEAYVIPVDEAKIIARDTVCCLQEAGDCRTEKSETKRSKR